MRKGTIKHAIGKGVRNTGLQDKDRQQDQDDRGKRGRTLEGNFSHIEKILL
jgi:hypothetical protein